MKIAIIGAGNMGGAIAQGIAASAGKDLRLTVSDPSVTKLEEISGRYPRIETTTENLVAIKDADVMILVVKPWILDKVVSQLSNCVTPPVIISVIAGADLQHLHQCFGEEKEIFRVIPNTAASVGESMTFIATRNDASATVNEVKHLFETMGRVAVIPESLMNQATALSSCGIAYVFKYIQACVQAGVQLGFNAKDSLSYTLQTVKGAVAVMEGSDETPQSQIDRVTTPGGMTIKGINSLEYSAFTAAVIQAILKPLEK